MVNAPRVEDIIYGSLSLEEFDGMLQSLGFPSILDDAYTHEHQHSAGQGSTY